MQLYLSLIKPSLFIGSFLVEKGYTIYYKKASIRRGTNTVENKKGYFEDRRPSSNCDFYLLIIDKMFETTCLL